MTPRRAVAALVVATALAGSSACSGPGAGDGARAAVAGPAGAPSSAASGDATPAAATSDPTVTALGVTVHGGSGSSPRVEVPAGAAAPASRQVRVLAPGTGIAVRPGDLLVTAYHEQSWAGGATASATLGSTWARGVPALAVAGRPSAVAPWGDVLAGRRVGARLLVVRPASSRGPASAVVLDLLRVVPRTAPGNAVPDRGTKGFPRVAGAPGAVPVVRGLAAVGTPSRPVSRLLVAGRGRPLQAGRTYVVQLVEIDLATRRTVNSTWRGTPLLLPAAGVLDRVRALRGAAVGSRAVAVLPAAGTTPARVLVLDVVAQV